MFQPTQVAGVRREGERFVLTAPAVGLWRLAPAAGTALQPGMSLGELEVLGVLHRLEVPEGAHGLVAPAQASTAGDRARVPVAFGDVLLELDPSASVGAAVAGTSATAAGTAARTGLVFRAPSSGRFYGRPGPDKPAFVAVGDVIATGHTVALLEVMKTFNRVQYGGPGLPARARVLGIIPVDDADLESGDPILELEPAE